MCAGKIHRKKLLRNRSSRLKVFSKEGVLRNFAKFTRKDLCQSLVLMNIFVVYISAEASSKIFDRVLSTPLASLNICCHFVYVLKSNYIIIYFCELKVRFLESRQTSFPTFLKPLAEAFLEPYQITKIKHFAKKLTAKRDQRFLQNLHLRCLTKF